METPVFRMDYGHVADGTHGNTAGMGIQPAFAAMSVCRGDRDPVNECGYTVRSGVLVIELCCPCD